MKAHRTIAILNCILMVTIGVAWLAGYRGAAMVSAGTIIFGIPAISPQYKYEPGVWMLGILVLFLTTFFIAMNLLVLNPTDLHVNEPNSAFNKMLIPTCNAALAIFFAFTAYATIVNFRLSRTLGHKANQL